MYITMLDTHRVVEDGISIKKLEADSTYDVSDSLGYELVALKQYAKIASDGDIEKYLKNTPLKQSWEIMKEALSIIDSY